MTMFCIGASVTLLGGLGGLVNSFQAGAFHLPRMDTKAGIWSPGWLGLVVTGAAAALIVWGVYSPAANCIINGDKAQETPTTISQIVSSLLIGIGGGRFLTLLVEKKADDLTKARLAEATQKQVSAMNIPEARKTDINSVLLQIPSSPSFASASLATDLTYLLSTDHTQCPTCHGTGIDPAKHSTFFSPPCPACNGKGYIQTRG